jgi:hypothetical protein
MRKARISGDFEAIAQAGDDWLLALNSIPKDQKWQTLKQLPIRSWTFLKPNELYTDYDPKSLFLEPVRRDSVTGTDRDRLEWLIKSSSPANGFTRLWNTLFIIIGSCRDVAKSPILAGLKWYLGTFPTEPFIEGRSGNIEVKVDDAAVVLRVRLTLNALWIWGQDNKVPHRPILTEVWRWLFVNPMARTAKMKKMKAALVQSAFACPSGGVIATWNENLSSVTPTVVQPANMSGPHRHGDKLYDCHVLLARKKEIDEALTAMMEEGLTLTATAMRELLRAPITKENMSLYSIFTFIEAMTGFMHDDFAESFKQTVAEQAEKDAPENPPYKAFLDQVLDEFWAEFKHPLKHDLQGYIVHEMTTRSSGMQVSRLPELRPTVTLDGRTIQLAWRPNSKVEYMMALPGAVFDEKILRASYTPEEPGRVFRRNVPARATRKVAGGTVQNHASEIIIAGPMQEFLERTKLGGTTITPLAPGQTVGKFLPDHRAWFYHSSIGDRMIALLDFSNYDESERFANVRKPMIDNLDKWIAHYDVADRNGGYKLFGDLTPLQALRVHWNKVHNAYYAVEGGFEDPVLLKLDQMLSGERLTLIINTLVHMAFQRFYLLILAHKGLPFGFDLSSIQGDDEITLFKLLEPFRNGSVEERALFANALAMLVEQAADANGLTISASKTWVRLFAFEYLKKMGMYGYVIPRIMQLQMNEKETAGRDVPPIDRMASRVGELREYVLRGGSLECALQRLHLEWATIRVVKGRNNTDLIIPYEVMWIPRGLGGVGMYSFNIIDPNVDFLLHHMEMPESVSRRIGYWVAAMARTKQRSTANDVASQVRELFMDGEDFVRSLDDPVRVRNAKSAEDELANAGINIGASVYYKRHESRTIAVLASSPRLQRFAMEDKFANAAAARIVFDRMEKENEIVPPWRDVFLAEGVTFVLGDVIPDDVNFDFVAGLDDIVSLLVRQLGVSGSSNVEFNEVAQAFRLITGDPGFPRDQKQNQPEAMANEMLKLGITTVDLITNYFVAKGAAQHRAASAALAIAGRIQGMMFVRDLAEFSVAGEGFTDRTDARVSQLVTVDAEGLTNSSSSFAKLLKLLGYAFLRNQPLTDSDGNFIERRQVSVRLTNLGRHMYLKSMNNSDAAYAVWM